MLRRPHLADLEGARASVAIRSGNVSEKAAASTTRGARQARVRKASREGRPGWDKLVLSVLFVILLGAAAVLAGHWKIGTNPAGERRKIGIKSERKVSEKARILATGKRDAIVGTAVPDWSTSASGSSDSIPPMSSEAKAVNRLGLKLLVKNDIENAFVSPLSVFGALSLVAAGTTVGSQHLAELEQLLGSRFGDKDAMKETSNLLIGIKPKTSNTTLEVANAVWLKNSIKEDYANSVAELFEADVNGMPATPAPINAWCNKKTHGMIPSLVDMIDPQCVAILTNAVFFKGNWMDKFKLRATSAGTFHAPSGPKECQMMRKTDEKMLYKLVTFKDGESAHVVSLPYEANEYTAKLILPQKKGQDAFQKLITQLAGDPDHYMEQTRVLGRKNVQLILPRFKVESSADLSSALKDSGLVRVFGEPGGFLRMSDNPEVVIDQVIHKVCVEVTEEGTKAAAATAVMMMRNAVVFQQQLYLAFDRPFLFFIEHQESGAILFAGRVDNPVFLGI